jgi:hypothetical protein
LLPPIWCLVDAGDAVRLCVLVVSWHQLLPFGFICADLWCQSISTLYYFVTIYGAKK